MPLAVNPNTFANNPLDRAPRRRGDPAWLAAQRVDSHSRVVPFRDLDPFVIVPQEDDGRAEIGWIRPAMAAALAPEDTWVFLGLKDAVAHFAVGLPADAAADSLNGRGSFMPLRDIAVRLKPGDAAILGQAKALVDWHTRHGFCAACGSATEMADAGYKRVCGSCAAEHFPRTDPVVITLIVAADARCLLARGPHFPENMYSALAGFVEPGEGLEEAVAREAFEEVGIKVGKIRYHSTQPWPFPSSLMVGCIAEAETTEIKIDNQEIVAARWVDRADLKPLIAGERRDDLWIPPPMAIAHQLIRNWVFEGADGKPDYSAYDS